MHLIAAISFLAVQELFAWSFVALSDHVWLHEEYSKVITEVKKHFGDIDFDIEVGDLDPADVNYNNYYCKIFGDPATRPAFFPAMGNHDNRSKSKAILLKQKNFTLRQGNGLDYCIDWKNVRIIVVDMYSDLGMSGGGINSTGLNWVKSRIESAPASIRHIFVAFHEPAYPEFRHVGDSFDSYPKDRDAFWKMLSEHSDRIRGVLNGHIHTYYKRVYDSVTQIVLGNAGNVYGNSRKVSNITHIEVSDAQVTFSVYESPVSVLQNFTRIDQWTAKSAEATSACRPLQTAENGSGISLCVIHSTPSAKPGFSIHSAQAGAPFILTIISPTGRQVARLYSQTTGGGTAIVTWNELFKRPKKLVSGLYAAKFYCRSQQATKRFIFSQ